MRWARHMPPIHPKRYAKPQAGSIQMQKSEPPVNAHSQGPWLLIWTEILRDLANEGVVEFVAYAALAISLIAALVHNMDTFVHLAGQFWPTFVVRRGSL